MKNVFTHISESGGTGIRAGFRIQSAHWRMGVRVPPFALEYYATESGTIRRLADMKITYISLDSCLPPEGGKVEGMTDKGLRANSIADN